MTQEERFRRLRELNCDPQLSVVESTILALLQTHDYRDRIISVPRLQEECQASGLSSQEFSYGFVRLLTRRLLEPRGDFTFALSAEAHGLGDAADLTKGLRDERRDASAAACASEGKSGI